MSFFKDLVNTVVRGALAFYTGGLSEVAFSATGDNNKAGKIGGAIGGVIGNTWGGGTNVTGVDGPVESAVDATSSTRMEKGVIAKNLTETPAPPKKPSVIKSVTGWMKDNPELTQMIGSGIANMFTPDEIDIMREKAKLASRNYQGGGLVNLPGKSGSFGDRANQERMGVRGDYAEESIGADSIDPFVGASGGGSTFNSIQKQRYQTAPQEYYDSLRKNRGVIASNMRR